MDLSFKNISALVIGDIILDIFLHGKSLRLSAEAPVPIVLLDNESHILGGAANVAANLRSLGVDVDLCGFVGKDASCSDIKSLLSQIDISTGSLVLCPDIHTITKTRVVSNGQHLVRFDKETPFDKASYRSELISVIESMTKKYDFIIVSDYSKGAITAQTMNIIKDCFKSIPVFVDPRPKSAELYKNTFCMTPNLVEAQTMLNLESEAEELARKMKELFNLQCVIITLSEKGLLLLNDKDEAYHVEAYQLQVKERLHRLDVSGAGDTLIGTMAACLSSGHDMLESAVIANIAAAVVVNKLGTAVCTIEELNKEIKEVPDIVKGLKNGKKVVA